MFKEIKRSDVPDYVPGKIGRMPGWPMKTLHEFVNSDMDAAVVVEHHHASVKSAYTSMKKVLERKELPVDVVTRQGKIYLLRKEE